MRTVTARLVGAAIVVRVGGQGPVTDDPHQAANVLLENRPVRIPHNRHFARRLRWVLGCRAIEGRGPDGMGRNFSDDVGPLTR